MSKITKDQIEQWKKQHGEVFEIAVDGKVGYMKKPDRKTLSYAMTEAQTNPLGFAEIILENGWLGGDEAIKTDDSLFMAVAGQIDQVVEIKAAAVKKL